MSFPILSTIIFSPLVGALLILLIPEKRATAIRVVAAGSTFVSLSLAIYLLFAYDKARAGLQFVQNIPWISYFGANYHLAADGMSIAMILLTSFVIFAGVFASWRQENRQKEFFIFLLILVTGVFGVFSSFDLFLFFMFYELAVIPMYLLIGVWGSTRKEYAAMKLTLYLLMGSAFLLVGMLILYFNTGLRTFDLVALQNFKFTPEFQKFVFPFLFFGFAFLVPMWPFHTWSPDGHVAAPTAVSMLHAGVLMKLGAYGIIRVALNLFPEGAHLWAPIIAGLCLVNVVYGAFVATAQKDFKYIIGYSSTSHMGYVLLGIASFNVIGLNGAVMQMFSHGIMTGLFFALVGLVYSKTHTRHIPDLGGLAHQMPIVAASFVIAGMTSLGLPGLSGFVAELLVFVGYFSINKLVAILAISGIVITAIYVLRAVQNVFFGPRKPQFDGLTDARTVDLVPLYLLMFVLLFFGFFPSVMLNLINTSVTPLVAKIGGVL